MSLRNKLARLMTAGEPVTKPAPKEPSPAESTGEPVGVVPTGVERRGRSEKVASLQRQLDRMVAKGRSELRERSRVPGEAIGDLGSATAPSTHAAPKPSDMLARLLRDAPSLATTPEDPGILPGASEQTPHGPVHFIRQWLEPAHCHGRAPVSAALDVCAETVARLALDPTLADIDPRTMLFIDTETTGLSTGAGTLPFLTGVAFFEDESLCVEQMLLTRLGEERPMLRHLADRIAASSCVVSYNGKSFDWPLLRTRFVMNRVPAPKLPPHLDLLHCARRAFKRRLRSMRLVEMETQILGMVREHDVDGAEIPGIFLTFLRSGNPGRLDGVVEHNGHDLVALAAFLGEIWRRFEDVQTEDDPLDHLSYALVAEKAGDPGRASAFAAAAAAGGGDDSTRVEALLLKARVARRSKDVDTEQAALLAATQCKGGCSLLDAKVQLELSKMFEHRRKDLHRALEHAPRALLAEGEAFSERRIARLKRRIERARSKAS